MGSPTALPARSQRAISTAVSAVTYWPPLGAAEDSAGADALPDSLHIQGVLVHEEETEPDDDRARTADRIHGFSIARQPLVGVDANVEILKIRRFHIRDLQFRPLVGRGGLLHSHRQVRQSKHAA